MIAEGHEIVGLSGSASRERIKSIGAQFRPLPAGADFRDIVVPELKNMPPGLEWLRVAMERLLVDTIPAQHKGLEQVLRDFAAEIIIGDDMFFGMLPKLLGPAAGHNRAPQALLEQRVDGDHDPPPNGGRVDGVDRLRGADDAAARP